MLVNNSSFYLEHFKNITEIVQDLILGLYVTPSAVTV